MMNDPMLKECIRERCFGLQKGRDEVIQLLHQFCNNAWINSSDGKISIDNVVDFCESLNEFYNKEQFLAGGYVNK